MDKFTIIVLSAISLLSLALLLIDNHGKVIPTQYKNDHSSTNQITNNHDLKVKAKKEIKSSSIDQNNIPFQEPFSDFSTPDQNNINVEYTQINPEILNNLVIGQEVEFLIPQESRTYTGIIEIASDVANGNTRIASGRLNQYEDSRESPTFSIVKEESNTFATIRTGRRIFRFEINNETGISEVSEDQQNQSENNTDEIIPKRQNPSPEGSRESFFDI